MRSDYDEEDDDDDDLPRSRRRRRDDDDIDVRGDDQSGMALASMILGIIASVSGVPGGCACLFTLIALICGIIAVILGFMSKHSPGCESHALTGIICGFVGIGLSVIGMFTSTMFFCMVIGAR
jgi:hypothetical protein